MSVRDSLWTFLRRAVAGALFTGYIALGSCHLWRLSDRCEWLAEKVYL